MDQSDFLGLKVGDAVAGLTGAQPIYELGPSRWYALRVRPQKEAAAEAWLARRGVTQAFHPVLRHQSLRCGKIRQRVERYLPGYVFARFNGEPIVHRVIAGPFITGAICRENGDWGILASDELRRLHSMRLVDEESEVKRRVDRERAKLARRPKLGGKVLFKTGLFAGSVCEVAEIVGAGRVKVRLSLFGSEALVDVDAAGLVRIGGLTGDGDLA